MGSIRKHGRIGRWFFCAGLTATLVSAAVSALAGEGGGGRRLLVQVREEASQTPLARQGKAMAASREEKYLSMTRTFVVEAQDEGSAAEVAASLANDDNVVHVEYDQVVQAHLEPDDEFFQLQWALGEDKRAHVNAERAWDLVNSSENIIVAVLDSGCDDRHPDLADNIWRNPGETPNNGVDDDGNGYVDDIIGYDFLDGDPVPDDETGHGTMVSGILGATGNNGSGIAGVSWNVQIMCLKFLGGDGSGNLSDGVEAVEYAIAHGASIINASWGYRPVGPASKILEEAIRKAQDADVLFVSSAGNDGLENDPAVEGGASYPSSYDLSNVLSVAATDSSDGLTSFSNYGAQTVDLAAPGVNVYTIYPGREFRYFSGTSASTPFVTGAAALLREANPEMGFQGVKDLLVANVDPAPSLEGKTISGGRLNVGKALTASPFGVRQPASGEDPPSFKFPESGADASGGCALNAALPQERAAVGPLVAMLLALLGIWRRGRRYFS